MQLVTKNLIRKLFPKRPSDSYKGNFGRLLIIGGSKYYSGSVVLAALGAYRCGADWVMVAAPEDISHNARSYSPDIITYPLEGEFFSVKGAREVLEIEGNYDAVVIGGGMGKSKEAKRGIIKYLNKTSLPCVIDADAIHAVSKNMNIIRSNCILTPHSYEFYKLTGEKISDRENQVLKYAQQLGATILLKGSTDHISDGSNAFINKTGNPAMTVAGTGDVLAGVCGALLSRKNTPLESACAAAFINGAAGDLAARKHGVGMLASDMLEEIPRIL